MKRDTLENIQRLRPSVAGAALVAERATEASERLARDGELRVARRELHEAEAAEALAAEGPQREAPESGARDHAVLVVERGKHEASAEAVQSLARKPRPIPTELELVRPLSEAGRRDMKTVEIQRAARPGRSPEQSSSASGRFPRPSGAPHPQPPGPLPPSGEGGADPSSREDPRSRGVVPGSAGTPARARTWLLGAAALGAALLVLAWVWSRKAEPPPGVALASSGGPPSSVASLAPSESASAPTSRAEAPAASSAPPPAVASPPAPSASPPGPHPAPPPRSAAPPSATAAAAPKPSSHWTPEW